MLHVISARCVARDLHTIAPGPLERTCWRRFGAQRGDCQKSRFEPFNAIIIIIIIYATPMEYYSGNGVVGQSKLLESSLGLFVGCFTSQQQASVSQGRICSDNCTCYHTEIEVADQTFYLNQSQYTDTGPTSPSADPITPGAGQGSHWSASFEVTGMIPLQKKSRRKRDSNPGSSALEADALPLGQRGGRLKVLPFVMKVYWSECMSVSEFVR